MSEVKDMTDDQGGTMLSGVFISAKELRDLRDKVAVFQAFKDWVHAWLDSRGVPKAFPDGPHTREGCRIGDRLEWLWAELERYKVKAAELDRQQRAAMNGQED